MEVLKFLSLFVAIFSFVLLIEQLYLITITMRNKGSVKMDGWSQVMLIFAFAAATTLMVIIW